jgi:hypothetical protein
VGLPGHLRYALVASCFCFCGTWQPQRADGEANQLREDPFLPDYLLVLPTNWSQTLASLASVPALPRGPAVSPLSKRVSIPPSRPSRLASLACWDMDPSKKPGRHLELPGPAMNGYPKTKSRGEHGPCTQTLRLVLAAQLIQTRCAPYLPPPVCSRRSTATLKTIQAGVIAVSASEAEEDLRSREHPRGSQSSEIGGGRNGAAVALQGCCIREARLGLLHTQAGSGDAVWKQYANCQISGRALWSSGVEGRLSAH